MKITYSLKTLIFVFSVSILIVLLIASRFEMGRLLQRNELLKNQLRADLEYNAYSCTGTVLSNTDDFVVYSILAEATFKFDLSLYSSQEANTMTSEIRCGSYVNSDRNLWTSHVVIVSYVDEGSIHYFATTNPFGSGVLTKRFYSGVGTLPTFQGFGSGGIFSDTKEFPIATEKNLVDIPFRVGLKPDEESWRAITLLTE